MKDEGRTKDLETLEGRLADLNRAAHAKNQTTLDALIGLLRDAMGIIATQNKRLAALETAGLNSGLGEVAPLDPAAVARLEELGDKLDELAAEGRQPGLTIDGRTILALRNSYKNKATTPEERAGVEGVFEAWWASTFHDTTLGDPHEAAQPTPVS